MEQFLTAGGKTLNDIVGAGAWECHSWSNCPTHVAFNAASIQEVPAEHRRAAVKFISFFDAEFLKEPIVRTAVACDNAIKTN